MKVLTNPIAGIAVLVAGVLACAGDSRATPSPSPAGPLLTVEWRGGLCPYGACSTTLEVASDGAYRLVEGAGTSTAGAIDAALVDALAGAVATADFDAARTQGFTETCPTAYDGQEIVYTFHAPAGDERMSTCEYVIEWEIDPFPQALAVIEAAGR